MAEQIPISLPLPEKNSTPGGNITRGGCGRIDRQDARESELLGSSASKEKQNLQVY